MAHQQSHRLTAFYLDQSSLECKAGCGFFGNPEWLGYCSMCFKQLNNNHQQQIQNHLRSSSVAIPTTASQTNLASNQFEQSNQVWLQPQQNSLEHQFQNMNVTGQGSQYYATSISDHTVPINHQITRSVSHMFKQPAPGQVETSHPSANPDISWQQQSIDPSYVYINSRPPSSSTDTQQSSYLPPFDKYEEKRRSQYTDKRSNVLKFLRRASTFKDKSHTPPNSPLLNSSQTKQSIENETLNNSEIDNSSLGNVSTGGVLSPSNLFSNLTSPSSLVMSGYDTLTNLHNTIVNTAKSSFRASPNSSNVADSSSIHSVSQSEYMHTTSGVKGSAQQTHFLYDVAWIDCLRLTKKFTRDFLAIEKQPDKSINHLSDLVHNFYQTMNDRFENQFVYKGATPDQLELLNDNMERILNEHIYQVISTRIINEDEEHNMAIQKRIRSLNWITVEHLEIDIDFQHPIVHDLLDRAICQMIEINSRTSSIDKLDCIVNCSKTIFELLQVNPTSGHLVPVSADQFLPVLVFVVIQANPPMLPADMKYLTRFSNPRRLMSGETGYYFTNLCCALEFIEKASGASLNISEIEFKKYVDGEAVPETKSQFNTYLCDGLRTMCSNDAALEELRSRNETKRSKMESLIEQIEVHLETNRAKLREMQKFTSNLKEKLQPVLPKFYLDIGAKNKDLANKLLPSYMRNSVEIQPSADIKLVDIETNDANDECTNKLDSFNQQLIDGHLVPEAKNTESNQLNHELTSLSPVEQLESDTTLLKLPEPIQPQSTSIAQPFPDKM